MSLYNMMFGVDNLAGLVLKILGITEDDVPRFRDAYFGFREGKEGRRPIMVLYTRTGGGNRDCYDHPDFVSDYCGEYDGPFNSDLRKLPGYIHDEDDEFDSTYASFYFNVPEEIRDAITQILEQKGETPTLKEKMDEFFKRMEETKHVSSD